MVYLIEYVNENVKVSIYDTSTNSYEILKNQGEEWQKYGIDFWKWFKERLKDDSEEIVFKILSDEKLEIDNTINAKVIYLNENEEKENNPVKKEIKQKNNSSLASYFIKEVEHYKYK